MNWRPMLWILPVVLSGCSPANPPSQAEVEKFLHQYIGEPEVSKGMALISREPTVSSIAYGKINQGWQTIRAAYEETAGSPIKATIGTVDLTAIGPDTSLAIAPMKLSEAVIGRTLVMDAQGAMTVLVKRTPDGLRLIHEHYSLRP